MTSKLISWLKNIVQMVVLVAIITMAMDYWRSPIAPIKAAHTPFTTLQQATPNTLAQLSHNQTLVLYFWGSWCGICKHTSPVINQLQQDNVPVLGVALSSGNAQQVRDYMRQQQLNFDTINDEQNQLSQQWQVKVTPSIILIKNGQVIHSTTGLASYWGLKMRIAWANWVS